MLWHRLSGKHKKHLYIINPTLLHTTCVWHTLNLLWASSSSDLTVNCVCGSYRVDLIWREAHLTYWQAASCVNVCVYVYANVFTIVCLCVFDHTVSLFLFVFSSGFPLLLAVRVFLCVCVCVDGYVLDGCDSLLLVSLCVKTLKKKSELHPTLSLFSIRPNARGLISTDRSESCSLFHPVSTWFHLR